MPELPPGWRVTNSSGEYSGQVRLDDDIDGLEDGDSSAGDGVDIRPDSPGWEDAEDDTETVNIRCLLCDGTYNSAALMLDHCKIVHYLDLQTVRAEHSLDFYSTIRLINYVRDCAKIGIASPDTSDPSLWAGDKFMQPVLENDALLFSLDELTDFGRDTNGAPVDYDERQAGAAEQHTDLDAIEE